MATGVLGAPTGTGVDNRFAGVNGTTTTVESDLAVRNPNPVGVASGGLTVDYWVTMNDVAMANGTKSGVSVERGRSTLPFVTYMHNERIPAWWVSYVRRGERTTLRVDADVHSSLLGADLDAPQVEREVTTDVTGGFNSTEPRPLNANMPPVRDPVLYLNEPSGTWGNTTRERTEIETAFVLYNPKPYPITLTEVGYDVRMNDVEMGSGSTARSYVIPPGETRTVKATTVLRTDRFDEWWVSHLERNQVTDLRVDFYLTFDLANGGAGEVRVPVDMLERTIETDVFDEKSDGGNASGGAGTATPDGTATSGDGMAAGEGTPEGERTSTPTDGDTATDGRPLDGGTDTATPTPTPTPTPAAGGTTTGGGPTDDGTATGNGTTTDGGLIGLDVGGPANPAVNPT